MPSLTLARLAAGCMLLAGCTGLVPVGFECPDRQPECAPKDSEPPLLTVDAGVDAGRLRDSGAVDEPDAKTEPLDAGPDAADAGNGALLRNASFEPVDPSGIVGEILQEVLDLQSITPWRGCVELKSLPNAVQVRSTPRNPVSQWSDPKLAPSNAAEGDYFLQFGALLSVSGFVKLTQPLSRKVEAGEEIPLALQAAAIEGNDQVFVRILGSVSNCPGAGEAEVLYEGPPLTDDAGWQEFRTVLRPTRDMNWITLTADSPMFDFDLGSPQLFIDNLVEE